MMKLYVFFLLSLLLVGNKAVAADDLFGDADEDLFSAVEDSSNKPDENQAVYNSSFLSNRIPETTVRVINKAEKVFCYTVDYAESGYEGYIINDLALKGSCGELSQKGKDLIKKAVYDNNLLYSSNKDSCNISPKIMLRYVYGADYTDVLFSTPCHSLTFFHGRDVTTLNAAPGAAVIDKIVKAYASLEEPYQSPALLGQMVGNGQAMNQRDKEVLRRAASSAAPVKKWSTQQSSGNASKTTQPAKSGWNKLR